MREHFGVEEETQEKPRRGNQKRSNSADRKPKQETASTTPAVEVPKIETQHVETARPQIVDTARNGNSDHRRDAIRSNNDARRGRRRDHHDDNFPIVIGFGDDIPDFMKIAGKV